jgi:hypothetical protein
MVDPFVDPSSIPQLREILRLRLLAKVRTFEAFCEKEDRLFQVVTIGGRPLALGRTMVMMSSVSPNPAFSNGTHAEHRSRWQAAWLDLHPDAYYLPYDRPTEPGQSVVLQPYLLSVECQHEHLSVPLDWLREQVSSGVTKRVITQATRFEMGTRYRGE